MKIFHKLLIGFLVIAVLMGCVGVLSFGKLKNIALRVHQLGKSSMIEFESADRMLIVLRSCQLSALQFVNQLRGNELYPFSSRDLDDTISDIQASLHEFSRLLKMTINATEVAVNLAQRYNDNQTAASEREELEAWLYPLRDLFKQYEASMLKFTQLVGADIFSVSQHLAAQTEKQTFKQMRSLIEEISEDAREEMHSVISDILDDYIPNATRIVVGSTFLGFLLAIVLGFTIARSISKPIMALEAAALKVGKGRMDARVDLESKDEIGVLGRAFNQMVFDLNRTTVSKIFLDNVIESMLDALIVTTPDLTIQMVNGAVCQLSGYHKSELAGKSVRLIIGPEEPESSIFDQLQLKGAVRNVELTCVTKQKRRIPILFSATVLVKDDQVHSIVCAARDIHERKEAEIALQKAHDKLEERVEKRTSDLGQTAERLRQELLEHRATSEALHQSEKRLRRLSYGILKAQEDERKRLANELHDELGQSLSLLKVQLGAMQRKLPPDQGALGEELQEMRLYLNQVIEDVRRLSRDLSPTLLADLGLLAALEKIGKDFAKYYPTTVLFETAAINHLFSQDTQIVIYRIFQEIFTNIAKHAQASHVQVEIRLRNNNVLMAVQDNGQGFDPAEVTLQESADKGLGLTSLYERARMINADFDLWSQKGQGTRLLFTIPIQTGELI
ncbi:MAG: histidine kinase [Thermodesulfobacteriota bacterium]|nr:histidine kinase [Thermodesulfobacteriota bacterium]